MINCVFFALVVFLDLGFWGVFFSMEEVYVCMYVRMYNTCAVHTSIFLSGVESN